MALRNGAFRFWLPAVATVLGLSLGARAADWPRWRGPKADAISPDTGLRKAWPTEGPPLLWRVTGLGVGYSSVSIVGDRLFTMGDLAGERGMKEQFIIALDLETRKIAWTARVGPPPSGGGPRCTPTVSDGLVYAIGTNGDLLCVDADQGKPRWQKSFARDFGGMMMTGWKYSESPLVDGDKLVCTPGGKDAMMVALDRKTGDLVWKCAMPGIGSKGKDGAGYSSMVITEVGGIRQYVQLTGRGLIGVRADDGKFLWGYNKIANNVANIPTPIVRGEYVFGSTAYETGSVLLKLVPGGDGGVKAEEVYFLDANTLMNHHGGLVLVGDHIYGGHGHGAGAPTCIELATGKVMWKEKQPGGGSAAVVYADGHLIFRYQEGQVVLVEATPTGFKLKGKFAPVADKGMSGPAWPHPVVLDGKLYLRHADMLHCYDLKPR